jgi:hypothetical protein
MVITRMLESTLADIDAGVFANVADVARAAVFEDFLEHAEHYLSSKRPSEAGVIAGVVFEDTVRKLCSKLSVGTPEEKLDGLITALEKAGTISLQKAKRGRAAADLRTKATHANWDKFEASDVSAAIVFTRELLEKLEN